MKRILACIMAALILISISACGNGAQNSGGATAATTTAGGAAAAATTAGASSGGAADSGKKVQISFMSHIYKAWNDVLDRQIREFEADNPNISVEYSTVEHADLNTKLMTSLAANTAPDIMGVYGPWMADLIGYGWLDAAPAYVEEDIRNNTFDIAADSAEYDGKLYGYIQHIGIPAPVINTAIWDEKSVPYPKTYDDLVAASELLDIQENGQLTQVAANFPATRSGSWNVITLATMLEAYGGKLMSDDGAAAAFNSPEGRQALDTMKKIVHPGFVENSFTLGRSGTVYDGPWSRASYVANAPDLKYKSLPPLSGPAGQAASSYVWFWSVAGGASQENRDAAWKLLNYMSGDEKYLELALEIGFVSFRVANFESEAYKNDEWIQAYKDALDIAEIYYPKIAGWENIDMIIGIELEKCFADEQSVEDTLNVAEELVNAALKSQ